jgi:hypothetical protein
MNVVFCQFGIFASSRFLVKRRPTDCGVSKCDREASIMRRPWPIKGFCEMGWGKTSVFLPTTISIMPLAN